jgi:hypothetical protein
MAQGSSIRKQSDLVLAGLTDGESHRVFTHVQSKLQMDLLISWNGRLEFLAKPVYAISCCSATSACLYKLFRRLYGKMDFTRCS